MWPRLYAFTQHTREENKVPVSHYHHYPLTEDTEDEAWCAVPQRMASEGKEAHLGWIRDAGSTARLGNAVWKEPRDQGAINSCCQGSATLTCQLFCAQWGK